MSEGTVRLIAEINKRIRMLARRMTFGQLLYGSALFLGLICAGILLAVGLEALLWMAPTPRTIIFWISAIVAAAAAAILLGPPLASLIGVRPGPDDETVAKAVGRTFPEVADRLLDLLQLASGRRSEAPEPLVDAAVVQLSRKVDSVDYLEVERFDDFRRASRLARWPLIGLAAFVLVWPGTFGSAAKRMMAPGTSFLRPAPFEIVVEPGDVRLVKGDSLLIQVRLVGSAVHDDVMLSMRRPGENRAEIVSLRQGENGAYAHLIPSVRDGFQYFVEAERVASPTYRVDVSGRPFVRSMQMTLIPPAYTGLPVKELATDAGDVSAVVGSTIEMALDLGGEDINRGELVFDEAAAIPVDLDGLKAAASFRVVGDDRYRVVLTSSSGVTNERPIEYRIRAVRDQRPSIFVLDPAPASEFEDGLDVDISARITDDFGFSGLSLYYRLAESRFGDPQETFTRLPLPKPVARELDQQVDYRWALSEAGLDLVPGDVITFYLEVADNDAVSGFKVTTSGLHTIRFPSLTDRFEAVDEQQNDLERALENLLNESDEIKESFQALRDELRRKQEGDWDDERMIERLKEQQSKLDDQVSDLAEKMESLVDEMTDSNLLSPETLEKFTELKRVVEEISSPELQEALERLKEAMMDLDLSEMQRSMGDFEFNEDQFRDRIERALELFKRLRTEQQLEEAARRAEDLSEREAEMAKQTEELLEAGPEEDAPKPEDETRQDGKESEDGSQESSDKGQRPDPERLAGEQERAAEDMKRLEELMQEIGEQMEELSPAPTEEMEQLLEQLEEQDMQNAMRRNAQDLRQGQLSRAQDSQQQMQQDLQQLSQQLSEMQDQMSGEQLQANLQALRRALDDVITLSLEEERLRDGVRNLASRDAGLRGLTQQQSELHDGLRVVGDTLSRLSRSIPQMSRQVQAHAGAASMDMSRAVEEMTEGRGQQAMGHQKGAMTNLNELALLLSDLMQSMQNQQGGMAGMSMQQMMQQLQQMAGQQGKLNEQIQQFLNDMQGSRLGQDMQARLQQMAAQQEALRKQLEEMGQNSEEAAGRLLGDLEEIARQMEETISEMQNRGIDRKTYERQQEILTRLLNAQRSMRERGKDNQRQGRTADEIDRTSPSELTPNERGERLRRELLRAMEAGYSPDYEELIRRYFEALQQKSDGQ
ncbi:MAG TPA: DUF4175 family protein [Rhodothermales bacterium]|nr:DUF4175 family protein [Rhodothermales bacterium]